MEKQITAATTARLRAVDPAAPIAGPLFAINWFNTRSAWMYALYNILAAGPLMKAGGEAFFKAKRGKMIDGVPGASREMVLIVRYPSGESFLNLLGNHMFQVISPLRVLAVKDFSFVFHKQRDIQGKPDRKQNMRQTDRAYAVHHFQSRGPLEAELQQIHALSGGHDLSVFFASEKAATLTLEDKNGRRQVLPFETHKLVIFDADHGETLESFLTGSQYRAFSTALESSCIGMFDRVL